MGGGGKSIEILLWAGKLMPSFIPTISATVLAGVPEFIVANFGQKGLDFAYQVSGIPAGISLLQNAYIPEASAADYCLEAETLGEVLIRYMRVLKFHASHNYMALNQERNSIKWVYRYVTAGADCTGTFRYFECDSQYHPVADADLENQFGRDGQASASPTDCLLIAGSAHPGAGLRCRMF